jgi:segregation and condensation protein A
VAGSAVQALIGEPTAAPSTLTERFEVHLANFEGPFDLLLSLISKHKLDITEVALSKVTDEFIGFIKLAGKEWDLEQTSSFLLVAATLLDLKAARLLPQGDVEDEEDLALLEARGRRGGRGGPGSSRARSGSRSGSRACCPRC